MPPVAALLAVRIDPVALVVAGLAIAAYLLGVRRARARGAAWPLHRTLLFLLLGAGGYLLVTCGFTGVYSAVLRYAFVTRLVVLVTVVPVLAVLGRPITLARAATGPAGTARVDRVIGSRAARALGNLVVAPLVPLAVFTLLLTPVSGWLRVTPWGSALVDVVVPAAGLAVAIPLAEPLVPTAGAAVVAEFMISFAELVADAIPAILLRLSTTVVDGMTHVALHAPTWAPSPLRDQQLAGDLLWCIAEGADIPAVVLLFVRWLRSDRRESQRFDDLSDEEYERLAAEHLRGAPPTG
ncbi:cytochrome c oxidase assembly protein [Amnibacterium kyonggiense]|uniref:Cytochrome c oxidase assembly factor CtaG n=1 Tax=Amnibacterium kyonggiense TaxID=595671 RepID=A0A4R7FHZ1_9MICO|nr:cytochrome c oxidase assembly protein [Amnibacterium kyonggiense]TDS76064.1 cytochrome c oxidase assembly factor CtaG [Amnibacterium kyonggiense]